MGTAVQINNMGESCLRPLLPPPTRKLGWHPSLWALSFLQLSNTTRKLAGIRSRSSFGRGQGFLGRVEVSQISVDPACSFAFMDAARCFCVPICLISDNPGYSENKLKPKQTLQPRMEERKRRT